MAKSKKRQILTTHTKTIFQQYRSTSKASCITMQDMLDIWPSSNKTLQVRQVLILLNWLSKSLLIEAMKILPPVHLMGYFFWSLLPA
ncbi:hypothetical protein LTR70_004311 [Exophiala xenobiotica]|nr:hypothetical protein LTR70_004311 [Exophiala xenobiotica]